MTKKNAVFHITENALHPEDFPATPLPQLLQSANTRDSFQMLNKHSLVLNFTISIIIQGFFSQFM